LTVYYNEAIYGATFVALSSAMTCYISISILGLVKELEVPISRLMTKKSLVLIININMDTLSSFAGPKLDIETREVLPLLQPRPVSP
jgi:hypothetical protein